MQYDTFYSTQFKDTFMGHPYQSIVCGKILLPHLDFREFLMYQALKAAEAASAIFTSVLSVSLLKFGAIMDKTKFITLKRNNYITNTCITTINDRL